MEASDRKELRVILDNINVLNDEWFDTFQTDEGQTGIHDALEDEIIKADKILAKRPRNCDVGTSDEQFKRWQDFCNTYDDDCNGCPCDGHTNTLSYCFAKWAQMPYKEGDVE